jgi:ADP-ribose pyrophosphatase
MKKWKILSSDMALDERWFKVRRDKVKLPSGRIVDDYFVWESPNIATVVPYTTDGKFVLCKQYRHGIQEVVLQFPSGFIDKDETPMDAADRELMEETGYCCRSMKSLSIVSIFSTKSTGMSHLFLAEGAIPLEQPAIDDTEETEIVLKSPQELRELIKANGIRVADSLAAGLLALAELEYDRR